MRALLIAGMQNDFMPGGALSVPDAASLIRLINALIPKFPLVIAVQDWHPADHVSFATKHPCKHPGEIAMVEGHEQVLWPPHCIENTHGAALVDGLHKDKIEKIFYKGTDEWIDSYSAFFDNARRNGTGLGDYLLERNVKELTIVGAAAEYCILLFCLGRDRSRVFGDCDQECLPGDQSKTEGCGKRLLSDESERGVSYLKRGTKFFAPHLKKIELRSNRER